MSALRAARAGVGNEAAVLLSTSGAATDTVLGEILRRAESICQMYDITGDERGRFPGAEFQKASLVIALVSQIGPRAGTDDRRTVAAISERLADLARQSSLLHGASENLRHGLSVAQKFEQSWHLWPLDDRHLGVGNYEASMRDSTFTYFHELIRDKPTARRIVKAAEVEVEDHFRYRRGRDITGPRDSPALNELIRLEADLCLQAIAEDLSYVADEGSRLQNGVLLSDFARAMSGLFAVLHRRRLILKSWAMRHNADAGHGLVAANPLSWYAREVSLVSGVGVDTAQAALSLLCSPGEGSNPSDQFLQRHPLVALGDGRVMAGCHLMQALRFAFLAIEHLNPEAREAIGDHFASAISQRLTAKGASAAANLKYDESGLKGDLDVVCLWEGRLLVAECKATSRFYVPVRTAHLRDEIDSDAADCAVKQVERGLAYIRLAPGRIAKELGVPEDEVLRAHVLPAILLSGMEFDGCSARGLPIRCGPHLVRTMSCAADLDVELAARPNVTGVDDPVTVEVEGMRFVIHSTDRSADMGAQ